MIGWMAAEDPRWWAGFIAGSVSVVLGLLLVLAPRRSVIALAWLAGVAIVVWGIRQAIAAWRAENQFDRSGGLFVALFMVAFGVAVVAVPDVTLRLLRVLIGIAAIIWGLMDSARPSLAGRSRWWGLIVRGLGSLALGLALIFVPEPTVSLIGILLGLLLILWGVVEVVASLALRPARGSAQAG
jgi:uncharacterized membrane protein HdeD (DUF308 family)